MYGNVAGFEASASGAKADYYLTLREFKHGHIEAVLKAVRPMMMEQAKSRFESSGAKTPGYLNTPSELSDAQRAENHNRAVRRAKQSIRFLCKEAGMDRLLTLTYRENMQDRELVREHFTKFLRLLRKAVGEWVYVAVLEIQDRGAYHIHCAVRGWQQISVIRRCWYKAIGGQGDERGDKTPGQVDVTSPRGARRGAMQWQTEKLAGYITKYLSKTFDEGTAEKRRFWAAKELEKPEVSRIWIGGTNVGDAIMNTASFLQTFVGLRPDFQMWLSRSSDTFWIAGKGSA
ncbi:MAG TPA: hypothetical protein VLC92_21510 [Rhodocyclaceae bacterium]|nr:hypothetical protein [Rhodocyclaceae bacterium]